MMLFVSVGSGGDRYGCFSERVYRSFLPVPSLRATVSWRIALGRVAGFACSSRIRRSDHVKCAIYVVFGLLFFLSE